MFLFLAQNEPTEDRIIQLFFAFIWTDSTVLLGTDIDVCAVVAFFMFLPLCASRFILEPRLFLERFGL